MSEDITSSRYPVEEGVPPDSNDPQLNPEMGVEDQEFQYSEGMRELVEALKREGIGFRLFRIEGGDRFDTAIVLDRQNAHSGEVVRIYRGIGHLDSSVLQQIPYAMRSEGDMGGITKPVFVESLVEKVYTLANNPTYENLLALIDEAKKHLAEHEVRRLEKDLHAIEEGILAGHSLRRELMARQIEHGSNLPESGISPYISATFSPNEAVAYGSLGIIVIDIPISDLEIFGVNEQEICIKGTLETKYITAILPRNRSNPERIGLDQDLQNALSVVPDNVSPDLNNNEDSTSLIQQKVEETQELDRIQWQKDVEQVRKRRSIALLEKFPEVEIIQSQLDQEADIYNYIKKKIFDYYEDKLKSLGKSIDNYTFKEPESYKSTKYDRENISDSMLSSLRELTLRIEERSRDDSF